MQGKVDLERAGGGVVPARRVVTHRGFRARRPLRTIGAGGRHRERASLLVWEEDLGVIVEAGAGEAGEFIAAERDADQVGRHTLHRVHLQLAKAQFMADTARQAVGGGRGGGGGSCFGRFGHVVDV